MHVSGVSFSIAAHAAWAPAITTPEQWTAWARAPFRIDGSGEPGVPAMPAMLRRRAGTLGKMALEVAYRCLDGRLGVPTVFVSRHGEVGRAVDLLGELVQDAPLSPTGFGLAVHNASAGLFSIARADRANHIALAAGTSSVEHAVIEACALLADGAPEVLLVAYDAPLPEVLAHFADCDEQPHAFAWLMVPAQADPVRLAWSPAGGEAPAEAEAMPPSLDVLRFHLSGEQRFERIAERLRWHWSRDA